MSYLLNIKFFQFLKAGELFSSVNEFVVYVLRDLVSTGIDAKEEQTKDETEAIRKRLKNLGYF